jgi:hypothetical protein
MYGNKSQRPKPSALTDVAGVSRAQHPSSKATDPEKKPLRVSVE